MRGSDEDTKLCAFLEIKVTVVKLRNMFVVLLVLRRRRSS